MIDKVVSKQFKNLNLYALKKETYINPQNHMHI